MTELDRENIKRILGYSQDFKNQLMGLETRPPYATINPLVYLGAHETHISHIFADILQYKIYDKETKKFRYPILESFIQRFFNDQGIRVCVPKIYAELGNIDILIKDVNYVIIIENKIKGATYQPWQPAKYVQKHKSADTKVFVVLLPKEMGQGEKSYIEETPQWCPAEGEDMLKYACPGKESDDNVDCYVRAIHKDFATWLSQLIEEVAIPQKETHLRSNIEILVDYLNGIYGIHNTSKHEKYQMDKIKLLKEILEYDDPRDSSLESLLDYKNQIDEIFEDIKVLDDEINKLYKGKIGAFMDICYNEILSLSAQENERMGEVSWPWRLEANPLHMGDTILIGPGSVNVDIKYEESEQRVMIGIIGVGKNLTQENVDEINVVLRDLGLYVMNLKTQVSVYKGYPFSEAKEQISKLITALLEIKHNRR